MNYWNYSIFPSHVWFLLPFLTTDPEIENLSSFFHFPYMHLVCTEVWKHCVKNFRIPSLFPQWFLSSSEQGYTMTEALNGKQNKDRWRKGGHVFDPWSGSFIPLFLSSLEHPTNNTCWQLLSHGWLHFF